MISDMVKSMPVHSAKVRNVMGVQVEYLPYTPGGDFKRSFVNISMFCISGLLAGSSTNYNA